MFGEKPAEAACVRRIESDELVEEKGRGVSEVGLSCSMKTTELGIRFNRCSACRETEHQIRSAANRISHAASDRSADFGCGF